MKKGDRVVCVRSIVETEWSVTNPVKGKYYTVREVVDGDAITLEEIINPKKKYTEGLGEACFYMICFRKLESYTATNNALNFNIVEEGLEIRTPQKETAPND